MDVYSKQFNGIAGNGLKASRKVFLCVLVSVAVISMHKLGLLLFSVITTEILELTG